MVLYQFSLPLPPPYKPIDKQKKREPEGSLSSFDGLN